MNGTQGQTLTITVPVPQPKPLNLDPQSTVLVIIDMQNTNLRMTDNPLLKNAGMNNTRMVQCIEGNVRLLSSCRRANVKVIYVQSVRTPSDLEFTVFKRPLYLIDGTD